MKWLSSNLRVPKLFQEFFGLRTTLAEILLILLPALLMTALLVWAGAPFFSEMYLWRFLIMAVLIFDILAGVVANLTSATNDHYADQSMKRILFIVMHIQPLVFSWLIGGFFAECLFVWLFTVVTALLVNGLKRHPLQRPLAGAGLVVGLTILLLIAGKLPSFLVVALVMFMIKVLYSFAVDHTAEN
jgi:hypothetical protein